MSLFPKKVECSFKETELHCLASHWLMRVWSCVVCCESSLSSSESIRESTLVSVHESCDVILLMFNDGDSPASLLMDEHQNTEKLFQFKL